jgi:hypothetical protein
MTPKAIADQLELSVGIEGSPIKLTAAIEWQLNIYFQLPKIQAAEKAERLVGSVGKVLSERAATAESSGTSPILVLLGTAADIVAGYSYILLSDAPQISALKQQRLHNDAMLSKIKSISFSDFELFGKKVLEELGAGGATVTKHSNDQGIDFYGRFHIGQLHGFPKNFFKLAHDVKLSILGQAKHYPTRSLGTSVVRELIGSISLAKTKTFSSDGLDIFKDLNIRPFSPVVALLLTTGKISSGAQCLADASGIIAKSGDQLANFLADRGVGMEQQDGRPVFNVAKFDAWLHASLDEMES